MGDQSGLAFLLQPEAFALDVEGGGVVQQPVQDGCGDHLVREHLASVHEPLVGGEDHRGLLVVAGHQAEEQIGLFPVQRQIADLVDDHGNPPIFRSVQKWSYAAIDSFCLGVIPPRAIFGLS